MPGKGRTKYFWKRYEEQRKAGYSKADAAKIADIIEERHRAKIKRRRR